MKPRFLVTILLAIIAVLLKDNECFITFITIMGWFILTGLLLVLVHYIPNALANDNWNRKEWKVNVWEDSGDYGG